MNTKTESAVTGEGTAPRGNCDHNSMVANIVGDPPRLDPRYNWKCAKCGYGYGKNWPQHEDIQRMAGFARMFHGDEPPVDHFPSLLESAEDERRETPEDDDDTRTLGLSSDESEAHEDAEDRGDLRDEGRSNGYGESYGERNQ